MPVEAKNRSRELVAVLATSLVMIGGYAILQSTLVQDWWKGVNYDESVAMSEIRQDLELTSVGERIFLATQPALEGAEDFNEHCNSHRTDVSLLGCYTRDKMYIYEIQHSDLKDSNKVTAAHELLHAAWERMSNGERGRVEAMLERFRQENPTWAEEELKLYNEGEQLEELYTRIATKLRDIPEELEQHYQTYFKNRLKIVEFYENYQAPFNKLQEESRVLKEKVEQLSQEIEAQRTEYFERLDKYDALALEFNACAEREGCFSSMGEFQRRRAELEAERVALNELREEVNRKIDENNEIVNEYMEKQKLLGDLNNAINSNAEKI